MMKFFAGKNHKEIKPRESKINAEENYAWCLQNIINSLQDAKTNDEKILALTKFNEEVSSNATQSIAIQVQAVLAPIIFSKKIPSDDYLISALMGIPINHNYISYEIFSPKK